MRLNPRIPAAALLAAALTIGGCDSTDDAAAANPFPQELAGIQSCMTNTVDALIETLTVTVSLTGDLQNPAAAATLTPTTDPLVWLWTIGEGNFSGSTVLEIDHAAGAATFTGVEREGDLSFPLRNVVVNGDQATLFIEYDRGDGRLIREQQTLTLAADGRSFTKTRTARYLDDSSVFVTCTGSATRQ